MRPRSLNIAVAVRAAGADARSLIRRLPLLMRRGPVLMRRGPVLMRRGPVLMRRGPLWSANTWLLLALLTVACAEPPNKEIGQAQGAVDAARAAGADRYATEEYTAATAALKQAGDAVTQRDYRLALNHAIESREHAQNAARQAAETRARLRGDVERSMAQVAALVAQANARMASAEQSRVPRRSLRDAQQALARINADVQKAGAAMQAEDYTTAQDALNGMKDRIDAVIASLSNIGGAAGARRRP